MTQSAPRRPGAGAASLFRRFESLIGRRRPSLAPSKGDLDAIRMNLKFQGYEMARSLAGSLPPNRPGTLGHVGLGSKPSTQADLESDWAAWWANQLQTPLIFHRKLWEFCYILQAFHEAGVLREGARGLGFGCGEEPLPSLLAAYGCDVVATDLDPGDENAAAWTRTRQHTKTLEAAWQAHLVDRDTFFERVSLEYVDMNAIPDHLRDFDFNWSICALEHLGSIAKGLDFIENSIDTLKPGGVAVHTTEFNFSREDTVDYGPTVLFQRKHFEEIAARLTAKGYTVAPLDFNVGSKPMDRFIDLPPFADGNDPVWGGMFAPHEPQHMKLVIGGYPSTCFGVIVRR